jgi:hypothetical protein
MWNLPFSYNIMVFVYLSLDTVFIVRGKIVVAVCGNAFSDIINLYHTQKCEIWSDCDRMIGWYGGMR